MAIKISDHECAFVGSRTIHPDYRMCAHTGCGIVGRVVVHKPALAIESSETSKEAARAIEPKRHHLRVLVFQALRGAPDGMTDAEIQAATGLDGSTERPRRVELVESNAVRDSGRTRLTKSGRSATVWECVE